nr:alcohol dehydrogenase catalytic domain-containing protein [Streptomyces sp. NBC_00830]WTB35878.1 alcohol dehydrogenase catalytic domain-containing protein [Streptomyces sp. NBC_00830]
MKALVYEAPKTMILREVEAPLPRPDEAVIRVAYSGICGSELSGFLGQNSLRKPPLVFGHELSGWIEAVGEDVPAAAGLATGTPVTVNPLLTCGRCDYCVTGRQQLCPQRRLLGAHLPGCNADLVAVPAASVLALPDGMSLRDAAMAEPAACALQAVETSGVGPASSALVMGAGPIGLFILQILKQYGVVELFVADLNPARLAMATALGATAVQPGPGGVSAAVLEATGGRGVDVSFDAVGSPQTRRDCLSSTMPGGGLVLVGLHHDETSFPVNSIIRSQVTLSGVFAYSTANFRTALKWLEAGRIGLREGVVVAPLSDGPQWYARLVGGDGAAKVLLQPGHDGEDADSDQEGIRP